MRLEARLCYGAGRRESEVLMILETKPKRICGGCTACCKTHGVHELHKGNGQVCPKSILGVGCSIHESQEFPFSCALYRCFWLAGKGDESDRPDKIKIVMDGEEFTVRGVQTGIWNMWEVERGARLQPRVTELTHELMKQGVVVRHFELVALNHLRQHFFYPAQMTGSLLRAFKRALSERDRTYAREIPLPGST